MKVSTTIEVFVVNVVLLLLVYLVAGDQAVRSAYAAREGSALIFSRSFLVQTTTLQGANGMLQSPLSLDWIQLLFAALIVVDVLYVYGWVERRRQTLAPQVPEHPAS